MKSLALAKIKGCFVAKPGVQMIAKIAKALSVVIEEFDKVKVKSIILKVKIDLRIKIKGEKP